MRDWRRLCVENLIYACLAGFMSAGRSYGVAFFHLRRMPSTNQETDIRRRSRNDHNLPKFDHTLPEFAYNRPKVAQNETHKKTPLS